MKEFCNCWIAILNDYDQSETNNLYLSNYKLLLKDRAFQSKNMAKLGNQWKEFSVKDYIDKRKSMSTMFDFCPKCGKKIDWRKLRKELYSTQEMDV